MSETLFRGTAGRRTFVQEVGRDHVMYQIVLEGQLEARFCTIQEWQEWCAEHAPLIATPGLEVASSMRRVVVRETLGQAIEVEITTKRLLTQAEADALVQRVAREAKSERKVADRIAAEVCADAPAQAAAG